LICCKRRRGWGLRAIWEVLATLRIPALGVHFLPCVASIVERPQIQTSKPICPTLICVASWPGYLRTEVAEFLGVIPAHATRQAIINDDPTVVRVARWTHPARRPRPAAEATRIRVLQTTFSTNAPISEAAVQRHVVFGICLELNRVGCIAE